MAAFISSHCCAVLFAGDDDIYQIAAAQALVGDAEQRVGVRGRYTRMISAFLFYHMVDKAGS